MAEKLITFECYNCGDYFNVTASKRGHEFPTPSDVRVAFTSTIAGWVYCLCHGIKIVDRNHIDTECGNGSHLSSVGYFYDPESEEGFKAEETRQLQREAKAAKKLYLRSPQSHVLTDSKHSMARWN